MGPLAASAILSAVPALYQMGTGIGQGIRARRLGKKKRPEYVIPGEINDNVDLARSGYNAASMYGLPGQGRIQNGLMSSQAQAQEGIMQSQQNPASMLLGLTSLNQNTNNSIADLGVNAAQFRQQNMDSTRQGLMSAKQVLAQYRDMEFEKNKMEPFRNAMQSAAALRAGSISNIYGGLGSLANTAGQFVNKGNSSSTPSTATPPISNGTMPQSVMPTAPVTPTIATGEATSTLGDYSELKKYLPDHIQDDSSITQGLTQIKEKFPNLSNEELIQKWIEILK